MHERASLRPDNNYGFCNTPGYSLSETPILIYQWGVQLIRGILLFGPDDRIFAADNMAALE